MAHCGRCHHGHRVAAACRDHPRRPRLVSRLRRGGRHGASGVARLAVSHVFTAGIAAGLGVVALYALSGAGVVRRLPCLRLVLWLVAAIFLARGLLGVPLVLLVDDPYMNELKGMMTFMILTSLVCVLLGVCYAIGAASIRERLER